jgi:signal transduction histidine kinase
MDPDALATIDHDLRGYLAVIVGYASLLESRPDEPFRLEASKHIQEAAALLTERLGEVLALLERRAL